MSPGPEALRLLLPPTCHAHEEPGARLSKSQAGSFGPVCMEESLLLLALLFSVWPKAWTAQVFLAPSGTISLGLCLLPPPPLLFLLMATKESSEQRWEEHSRRSQIRQRLLGSLAETGEGPRWGWAGPGRSRDAFPRREGGMKQWGSVPPAVLGGKSRRRTEAARKVSHCPRTLHRPVSTSRQEVTCL